MSVWNRLEAWLAEDPEINSVEIAGGQQASFSVRFAQACEADDSNLLGERVIADVEAESLEGAVEAALLVAAEGRGEFDA